MSIFCTIFLNTILVISSAYADVIQVNFKINAPFNTPEHSDLFLTGNIPELCHWSPDCIKLANMGNGLFSAQVLVSDEVEEFEFKITRGSWHAEAADWLAAPYKNYKTTKEEFANKELILEIVNWTDLEALGIKGNVDIIQDFYSPELDNSRTLEIWLPKKYYRDHSKKFRVLYMHDGEQVFNPATATHNVDWAIDDILWSWEDKKFLDDVIVVAIHSQNRSNEYSWYRLGHKYADFVVNTVKPFIDKNYRTETKRESTYTMGSSFGAYISFAMLWKYPETFSKAAALSLPAWISDYGIFQIVNSSKTPTQELSFYMDHGTIGFDSSYGVSAKKFYNLLKARGLNKRNLHYQVFPYGNHKEADWARRVQVPLKFLLF